MSYLDQPRMTSGRIWAIVTVAIIHVLLGIALVTGFANKFVKAVSQDLKVIDVEEPPPPEEEPPPPEDIPEPQAPEIVTPPPLVRTPPPPQPPIRTVTEQVSAPFNPEPPRPQPAPATPPPVPAPVPPASPPSPARQRSGSISDADYPAAAQRAEAQGTTGVSFTIGADGRVTSCSVTASSGNASLDSTTCSLIQRRFRYTPATQNGQPVASTQTRRVQWRLPRD